MPLRFSVLPLARIVRPLPLIVPPVHVSVPVIVTSPEPASVPPEKASLQLVSKRLAPLRISVFEEMTRVCVPLLPPIRRLATVALTFNVTV